MYGLMCSQTVSSHDAYQLEIINAQTLAVDACKGDEVADHARSHVYVAIDSLPIRHSGVNVVYCRLLRYFNNYIIYIKAPISTF